VIDIARAQDMLDAVVEPVASVLAEIDSSMPEPMIVGSVCRDALDLAAGNDPSRLRKTDDLDIAVAVSGWGHFETLTGSLEKVKGTSSTIRYRVGGLPVDIVPFGPPVESPDGVVTPARRLEDPMSVFGFQDVWAAAYSVQLAGPLTVRIPTIPGYTVLKLKAWADRSVLGERKDASDLATAMHWYQQDEEIENRLYEAGFDHLIAAEHDPREAAVRLLVAEARELLTSERQSELTAVWENLDDDVLVDSLVNSALKGWPPRGDERLAKYVAAVGATLAGRPGGPRPAS